MIGTDGIRIKGHVGTWYVVDRDVFYRPCGDGTEEIPVLFLESEVYGDEAAWLCVDENGEVVLEDIWNGVDDLREYEELLKWECEARKEIK